MTNGEKFLQIFPTETEKDHIDWFGSDWWNKEYKGKWTETKDAIKDIPKEGCFWVTFFDGKHFWVDLIYWDGIRWKFLSDQYSLDKENLKNIYAYMPFEEPEPYEGDFTHLFENLTREEFEKIAKALVGCNTEKIRKEIQGEKE